MEVFCRVQWQCVCCALVVSIEVYVVYNNVLCAGCEHRRQG